MEGFDLSRKQIQRLIKDMREEGLVEVAAKGNIWHDE